MAERPKAAAWKACTPQGIQGSNPCLSAIRFCDYFGVSGPSIYPMLKHKRSLCSLFFALLVLSSPNDPAFAAPVKAQAIDLVVYGGTASGVVTAYSGAMEGLHVVLL